MEDALLQAVRATPYPLEAFLFVQRGLEFTARRIHGPQPSTIAERTARQSSRHISGRDLSEGLRDLALEEYGPLARLVLDHWRVRATDDFGAMVFAMIRTGLLSKTDKDRQEDFHQVFDFSQAFPHRQQPLPRQTHA